MSNPKPMPKKPNVRIKCNQRVRYDQSVALSEDELEGLKRVWGAVEGEYNHEAEKKLCDFVDGIVDHADVEDGDDLEDIEVEFLEDE